MVMTDKNTALYALFLLLLSLFVFSSPTTFAVAAEAEAEPPAVASSGYREPYQAVNEFCSRRANIKDQEFCLRALKPDPRSAAAKDVISLLQISVDLAVRKAIRGHQFLTTLSKNDTAAENQSLAGVLKDCSFAYDWCLKELKMIPRELMDDAAMASYDALMASDALKSCSESMKTSKIANHHSISRMHRTVSRYVSLCVDIARHI